MLFIILLTIIIKKLYYWEVKKLHNNNNELNKYISCGSKYHICFERKSMQWIIQATK